MYIGQMTCGSCGGRGFVDVWKVVSIVENIGAAEREEVTCGNCNGKGYIEYPVFSVEDAKAIMKHCGLSIDGEEDGNGQ